MRAIQFFASRNIEYEYVACVARTANIFVRASNFVAKVNKLIENQLSQVHRPPLPYPINRKTDEAECCTGNTR